MQNPFKRQFTYGVPKGYYGDVSGASAVGGYDAEMVGPVRAQAADVRTDIFLARCFRSWFAERWWSHNWS